jgi:hypothetical protein
MKPFIYDVKLFYYKGFFIDTFFTYGPILYKTLNNDYTKERIKRCSVYYIKEITITKICKII